MNSSFFFLLPSSGFHPPNPALMWRAEGERAFGCGGSEGTEALTQAVLGKAFKGELVQHN
jgi:hypothetical protein